MLTYGAGQGFSEWHGAGNSRSWLKYQRPPHSSTTYFKRTITSSNWRPPPIGSEGVAGPSLKEVTDSMGISDAILRPSRGIALQDGFGLSDLMSRPIRLGVLAQDSFGSGDEVQLSRFKFVLDSLGLLDIATRPTRLGMLVPDNFGLTDMAIRATREIFLQDSLGFTDLLEFCKLMEILDSITLTDEITLYLAGLFDPRYTSVQRVRNRTGLLSTDDLTDSTIDMIIEEAEHQIDSWAKRDGVKPESWSPTIPPLVVHTATVKAAEMVLARKQFDGRLASSESRSGASMSTNGNGVAYLRKEAEKMWQDYLASVNQHTAQARPYTLQPKLGYFKEDDWRKTRKREK